MVLALWWSQRLELVAMTWVRWGALWGFVVPWRGLLLWHVSVSEVPGFLTTLTLWYGKAAIPLADSPCTSQITTRQTEKQKKEKEAGVEWCDVLIGLSTFLGSIYHKYWFLPLSLFPSPSLTLCLIISDSEACSTLIGLIAWDKTANFYLRHFLFLDPILVRYVRALEFKLIWQNQCTFEDKFEKEMENTSSDLRLQ